MGSPHISFTVSLSFHKHLNGTQLNVTPTPQDSAKLAFPWRHVWELKFSGARSHRPNPSSLWARNPVRFLFLSLLFSFTTSSLTLKICECAYWLSRGCLRDGGWAPSASTHLLPPCSLISGLCPPSHWMSFSGLLGSTQFTSLLHLCASRSIFSFSTLLIAKFHQLLSWNLLNLWHLILFLGHHLRLGFWPSHVDYWNSSVNWWHGVWTLFSLINPAQTLRMCLSKGTLHQVISKASSLTNPNIM